MSLAIVAIPSENDPVWKYSSEKKPHCTLLFLGEDLSKSMAIAVFLQHAVEILDQGPFGLTVDYRGTLGVDEADVLFFREDWATKELGRFRAQLLKNNDIRNAYDSVEQFPGWSPHLTMGYPSTPAKKDDRDYPGFHWVEFDRIALWTGNYEGPEFRLEYQDLPLEVMMSNLKEQGKAAVEEALSHHGVKGMKWGVRKQHASVGTSHSRTVTGKAKVKTTGGTGHQAHADAVKVEGHKQKLKKSGTKALSDQELRDIINRTQLESQARAATAGKGKRFVSKTLGDTAKQQTTQFINEQAQKQRKKAA